MSLYRKATNVIRKSSFHARRLQKKRTKDSPLSVNETHFQNRYNEQPSSGEDNLLSSEEEEEDEKGYSQFDDCASDNAVISSFTYKSSRDIDSICVSSGRAYLSSWNDNKVTIVDKRGRVKAELVVGSIITDLSYSEVTRQLWMCCRDRTIREVISGSARTVFKTEKIPFSLCVTYAGSILVGIENQIVEYDMNGKILKRIDGYSKNGKPKLVYPKKIVQCPVEGDYAVVDLYYTAWGGDGFPHILVFGVGGLERFRYHGPPKIEIASGGDKNETSNGHTLDDENLQSNSDDKTIVMREAVFKPWDICYNKKGKLIVADFEGKAVYLVNSNGQHLQTCLQCSASPCAVGLQSNGCLWVGDRRKKIQLIRM